MNGENIGANARRTLGIVAGMLVSDGATSLNVAKAGTLVATYPDLTGIVVVLPSEPTQYELDGLRLTAIGYAASLEPPCEVTARAAVSPPDASPALGPVAWRVTVS